jgi:putative aminopeptidase FrvX
MNSREFCRIAQRLMNCPAAPYYEQGVSREMRAICAEQGLSCHADDYGNLIVSLATASRQRPLVLAAHMDHPGFEVIRRIKPGRWLAQFNGGVGDSFFRPGVALRLMPGSIAARLGKRLGKAKQFHLESLGKAQPKVAPQFAVWDLPNFQVRKNQIHGRSCDDLIGVAAILATLIELKQKRIRTHVIGVVSRAEEVGFRGALAAAASGLLPQNAIIVSLETSREMPPVTMGGGVIVRVGDRTSIFDSQATRYLTEVATQTGHLQFQRALMSGGTCEATAYQEFGYQTCAVCVALGNYHNCAPGNRIGAEYIAIPDALSMARLLVEAVRQMPSFEKITARLPQRLKKLMREGRQRLKRDA